MSLFSLTNLLDTSFAAGALLIQKVLISPLSTWMILFSLVVRALTALEKQVQLHMFIKPWRKCFLVVCICICKSLSP